MRVGHGIDVHAFTDDPERVCVLGGVVIPGSRGLAGHSDGDVVVHAICDAVLGAAALGDIGHYFPDTDPAYRNIRSTRLLERVVAEAEAAGYKIGNVDVTVLAQEPRLAPHISAMRAVLAEVMGISAGQISIKATTTEGLGFVGRREGVEVHAVCFLRGREE
ncbi:MAG: 2-C-methyl-D-erythritol 2,4-cyclodiphosphate synthase [bacterium]|nr:2-C-methyl-D-erythritol 2,4-cyclodiphosphate synthase [bacterium]